MKSQVLSIEQMRHLQELGVDTSKAKMCWYAIYETEPNWYNELRIRDEVFDKNYPHIPTFTLQDILEILPKTIENWFTDAGIYKQKASFEMYIKDSNWHICYSLFDEEIYSNDCDNLLTCAYETLCWCAENNYLKGGDLCSYIYNKKH